MKNLEKLKVVLSFIPVIAIFYVTALYGQNFSEWLSLNYPYTQLAFEIIFKLILAVAPIFLFFYVYNENRKLISSLNSDSKLPPRILKRYGAEKKKTDFNNLELYFVGAIALIAGALWAVGLSYYLFM